jgi:hypothetical protein
MLLEVDYGKAHTEARNVEARYRESIEVAVCDVLYM